MILLFSIKLLFSLIILYQKYLRICDQILKCIYIPGFIFVVLFAVVFASVNACEEGVLSGNPADCSTYFQCANGNQVMHHCSPGLEWNESAKNCDWPENANCKATSQQPPIETTEQPSQTTQEPSGTTESNVCTCPAEDDPAHDVLCKDPEDCKNFYKCYQGKPALMHCPPGQEWANDLKRCDWPSIAKCQATSQEPPAETTKQPTQTTTQEPSGTTSSNVCTCPAKDDPEHDVLCKNPEDCGSFYKCYQGKPTLIKCPSGQEWANDLKRCDWPSIAKCQ